MSPMLVSITSFVKISENSKCKSKELNIKPTIIPIQDFSEVHIIFNMVRFPRKWSFKNSGKWNNPVQKWALYKYL